MDRQFWLGMILLLTLNSGMLRADSIVIGTLDGFNTDPFGGPIPPAPGTRYQQAYASADFTGPISITGIDFLDGIGFLGLGPTTYTLSLSTITAGIDTLSDTNFDSNLGADNTLFETVALSGFAPTTLSFTGGPFQYDPANGNLLLDISVSPSVSSADPAAYAAMSGDATGIFSRYQNFSEGTVGWGLVTEFDFSSVPEPSTYIPVVLGIVWIASRRIRSSK